MVVVVTTGVYTVEGAIQAGMAYVVFYQLLDYLPSQWRNLIPDPVRPRGRRLRAASRGHRRMAEATGPSSSSSPGGGDPQAVG